MKAKEANIILEQLIFFGVRPELPELIDINNLIKDQERELEELKEALKCNQKSK